MRAKDVMSSPVSAVRPQTPVLHIAAMLRDLRIAGLPVVANDELVGIVTERDLLHRQELGTEHRNNSQAWWRRVVGPGLEPERYVRSHGRCAEHVMTRNVIAVELETPLREIMELFDHRRIGRVPVLKDGLIVGIVTCADLVKALARGEGIAPSPKVRPSDENIRECLESELRCQEWWTGTIAQVEVEGGVVRFTGFYENNAQRRASCVAAENTYGVQDVRDERRSVSELPVMF